MQYVVPSLLLMSICFSIQSFLHFLSTFLPPPLSFPRFFVFTFLPCLPSYLVFVSSFVSFFLSSCLSSFPLRLATFLRFFFVFVPSLASLITYRNLLISVSPIPSLYTTLLLSHLRSLSFSF